MALPTEELKRRIDAARTLRGLNQKELAGLLQADGLGKHDVGRLERGELDLRRVHLDALRRHLQMPEWWFTADTVDLPDATPATVEAKLDALADQLGAIEMQIAVIAADPTPQTKPSAPSRTDRASETQGGAG